MSKFRKFMILTFAMLLGVAFLAALGACIKEKKEQLSAPSNLYIDEDEFLHWEEVPDAEGYFIIFNDEYYTTTETFLDLFDKTTSYDTPYRMSVMAIGDTKKTFDSEFSEELEYTIPRPSFLSYQLNDGYAALCANPNEKYVGKLIIPSNATTILKEGFKDCAQITGLWIPDSVSNIQYSAFMGCINLRRVRLPEGELNNIDNTLFSYCSSLWDVKIPNNITSIGNAFNGCALREITIPATVRALSNNPFNRCPLERIEVEEGNPVYYSEGNCVIRREDNRLEFGCGTSVIPDTVKSISLSAFSGCRELTSIVLPEGLETIASSAFADCSLESITIPKSVTSCASFNGCNRLQRITVAEGNPVYYSEGNCLIERATKTLVAGCNASVIPNDVEIIGASAFSGLNITEIVIPESVKTIDNSAFYSCHFLKSIRLPEGLETIKRDAFIFCDSLQAVILPNSVGEIDNHAFYFLDKTTFFSSHSKDEQPNDWTSSAVTIFWGCTFGYDGAYPYVISTADMSWDASISYFPYNFGTNYMSAPERAGYTFAGWATEEGGAVVYKAYTVNTYISVSDGYQTNLLIEATWLITFDCPPANWSALREELYGKTLYAVWISES